MASREEEEFELVLGNKQLLSLFFLVVVLFGVFFSFGYTVGYGRGEDSRTRDVGSAEPVEEPAQAVQLPETLLESAPKPTEPAETPKAEPTSSASPKTSPPPAPTRTTPAKAVPKPSPVEKAAASPPPPPTRSTPAQATAQPKSAPPPATGSGDYQLQISAVRVRQDAEVFVQQLKAKGHPAILSDRGDGWYRVMVGPFSSESDAKAYQPRLEKDGLESLVRRR